MSQKLVVVSRDTFNQLLSGDPAAKREALVVLAQKPSRALQLLQDPTAIGLSPMAAANVLDEVVAVLPKKTAAAVLAENLTTERLAELLAERGDLGSTAALLANRQAVFLAMVKDLAEEPLEQMASTLFAWAQKLKDRTDWVKMLDMRLGSHALRWYLLMYIWNLAGQPVLAGRGCVENENDEVGDNEQETLEDMNLDQFDEVGLDVDDSMERLTGMIRTGQMLRWEASLLQDMTRRFLVHQHDLAAQSKLVGWEAEVAGVLASPAAPADTLAAEIGDELNVKK